MGSFSSVDPAKSQTQPAEEAPLRTRSVREIPGPRALDGPRFVLGPPNVERLVRTHTNLILEAVLQDWRPHVLPWEHEMVFDEPEEEDDEELEDS